MVKFRFEDLRSKALPPCAMLHAPCESQKAPYLSFKNVKGG
jgi:hypothetical protein